MKWDISQNSCRKFGLPVIMGQLRLILTNIMIPIKSDAFTDILPMMYNLPLNDSMKWAETFTGWFLYISLDSYEVWMHLQTFYNKCLLVLDTIPP